MIDRRGPRTPRRLGVRPPSAPRHDDGAATTARATLPKSRASEAEGPPRRAPLLAGIPLGWRMADAYLAIAALSLVELFVVALLARRELVGLFEVGRSLRDLMPLALAAAGLFAVAGGALVELIRHASRPAARAATAAVTAAFAGVVAFGVSTGRHFAGGGRAPFVVGVALVCGALAAALAPPLARALARRGPADRSRRAAIFVSAAGLVLALEVVNRVVLPRLYPAFHAGLTTLAVLTAPFVALAIAEEDDEAPRPAGKLVRVVVALLLFTAGAAGAPAAARRLSRADNIRLIFLERAPILARIVELGAILAPPDALEEDATGAERPGRRGDARGGDVSFEGRDVVLITIDALRADHVGAYGYARKTTPNLDKLAAEGAVFEAAYTQTPHTSYAITSLMTGKYMRPLLLQGLGADSETWAQHLRRYGYRTAAFYPPAVFFIDQDRLASFEQRGLDFEYRKVQFARAKERASEVRVYIEGPGSAGSGRLFLWAHLFEPHEPYEAHAELSFGDRDVDRYDAEIAAADAGLGEIVDAVRAARPGAVIIATADHGEEFLEHGGRYHGTTVFEEQVRVPLVISAPGLVKPQRVAAPVQLIDLLPTALAALDIPRPARVRGEDLRPLLTRTAAPVGSPFADAGAAGSSAPPGGATGDDAGFAFSETDGQTLLARGSLRLICARKVGACALYDVAKDPGELTDVASLRAGDFAEMRSAIRALEASHGRYEISGQRLEGKGFPEALRRGIAGDADAAIDVAALLDDADVVIRRKAGEVLFDLKRAETSPSLRLALLRDEDDEVRRWAAVALTRLGEGAPKTRELLEDSSVRWRRLAALSLAEAGDDRGEATLIAWWREAFGDAKKEGAATKPIPFERAREIAAALAKIRSKDAVPALLDALDDVRLRPYVAEALAAIGSDAARPALAKQLSTERYQTARIAIAQALVKLGAGPELRAPLVWLLGTPDPLPGGLKIAMDAGLLESVGGPKASALVKLQRFARSGVAVGMLVPKPTRPSESGAGGEGAKGLRVLCRARSLDRRAGEVRVGLRAGGSLWSPGEKQDSLVPADAPELDASSATIVAVPASQEAVEVFATLPATLGVKPGTLAEFVVYATQNVDVLACAVVPLSDELPPPPPKPWEATPKNPEGAP